MNTNEQIIDKQSLDVDFSPFTKEEVREFTEVFKLLLEWSKAEDGSED